ncbi:hypothetical protein BJV77DRAFT_782092 [Russula vinacea]|nr:hypothetical protein BJV77DRAFT_782092 [Russula vinacea]
MGNGRCHPTATAYIQGHHSPHIFFPFSVPPPRRCRYNSPTRTLVPPHFPLSTRHTSVSISITTGNFPPAISPRLAPCVFKHPKRVC